MWKEMVAYFNLKTELTNSLTGELIYVFKSIFLNIFKYFYQIFFQQINNSIAQKTETLAVVVIL